MLILVVAPPVLTRQEAIVTASAIRVGRGFWLLWTAAGIAGLVVGAGLLLAFSRLTAATPHKALMGAVVGATVGTLQWLLLRRRVPGALWWLPATVVAWGVSAPAEFVGGMPLAIALLALLAGVLQGAVLRRTVSHPFWWLIANLGAWSAFLGVVSLVSTLAHPAAGIGVGFTCVGAITGLALTRLLSQVPPQNEV